MMKKIYKFWPVLFCVGALLSYWVDGGGMDFIEIHYRLFIIMGLVIISFGGFLLSMFPPVISFTICMIIMVGWLVYTNKKEDKL